jgi:hypothetical protein
MTQLNVSAFRSDPLDILMPPRHVLELDDDEIKMLSLFLQRFTGVERRTCRSVIPSALPHYAKVRIDAGGDTIHARDMVGVTDRSRDASYVRVRGYLYFFGCSLITSHNDAVLSMGSSRQ